MTAWLHRLFCASCRELYAAHRDPWPKDRTVVDPRRAGRDRLARIREEARARLGS